jgi:hypothetical protein
MTLYKHGVGFFERRARFSGEEVELTFRAAEMNDILKSLTAIDQGGGQVLGIDYATPRSREERLSGSSVRLSDDRSLRDLLVDLRGRRVRLLLAGGERPEGLVVGLDEPPEEQAMGTALVSLLLDDEEHVRVVELGHLEGVEILDEEGATDLRFFLRTALGQEESRRVTVRLTPGEHELSVRYVAPAPTWRVSYRLVAQPFEEASSAGERGDALLQGWGIFDNQLEEDLRDISLALVAGMPISFVYDLYTPFTPERPVVEEEARTAPGPVEFAAKLRTGAEPQGAPPPSARSAMRAAAPAAFDQAFVEEAAPARATGKALGELFAYAIDTPVTVARGRSAMVPIVGAHLTYSKDLLYNGRQLPDHPVATLRFRNETGLTLERGPVTVIEGGEYVGEAILPFTAAGAQVTVPYAVELGARVQENSGSRSETRGLSVEGGYLLFEVWDVRWREYQVVNRTDRAITVLVEHPRRPGYEPFDVPEPRERTGEHLRFALGVRPGEESTLRVQERRLTHRKEELRRQSLANLQRYLRQGFLDRRTLDRLSKLLILWESIGDYQAKLKELAAERDKLYTAQGQIRDNIAALSQGGKEGALRARYVEQLEGTEERLAALEKQRREIQATIDQVEAEVQERLEHLG